MTFDLIRAGWPNTAAILALAMMPIVTLATGGDRGSAAVRAEQIEPAAICLTLAECAVVAATEAPETILQ
jgi:hypothetical protein